MPIFLGNKLTNKCGYSRLKHTPQRVPACFSVHSGIPFEHGIFVLRQIGISLYFPQLTNDKFEMWPHIAFTTLCMHNRPPSACHWQEFGLKWKWTLTILSLTTSWKVFVLVMSSNNESIIAMALKILDESLAITLHCQLNSCTIHGNLSQPVISYSLMHVCGCVHTILSKHIIFSSHFQFVWESE